MTPREDWEATFIPGTDVLANKLGITDAAELKRAEYAITASIQQEIGIRPIGRTYDLDHLKQLDKTLFGDIYE